ncbi:MAG: oligosaccharide flippase family protein [Dehalococcoidia bacterium]
MVAAARVRRAVTGHALYRQVSGHGTISVLLRGAAVAFTIGVLTRFISFPVNVVLARAMGVAEFGIFGYVATWAYLLGLVALLGFDSALKRFVAVYHATGETGLLRGVLRRAYEVTLAAAVVVIAGLVVTILVFGDQMGRSLTLTLLVAAAALPLEVMHSLQTASLVAMKKVASSQTLSNLMPSVLVGLAAGVLYFARDEPVRAYEVYLLGALATGCLLLVGRRFVRSALPEAARAARPVYRTREWVRVSLPMLLVDGIREVMNRSDVILIGLLVGTTPAGIYIVALNLARFTSYGLQATTTASLPLIAELHATGNRRDLQRMFATACWAATATSTALAIAIVAARGPLLGLFGEEFAAGSTVMAILIGGRVLDAWSGPNGSLLNMTGNQDVYAAILGITAVVNVALTYPAVLQWGIEGAAVVTGLSLALKNVAVWVVVKRRMGLNASIFGGLPLRGVS